MAVEMWAEYAGAVVAIVALVLAITYGRQRGRQTAHRTTVTAALDETFGVAAFTLDGRFITANERFLNLVGYRLPELRGKHHRVFEGDAVYDDADDRQLWEALARGERRTGVYQWVFKGGTRGWVGAAYFPVRTRGGRTLEVVAFVNNITERKDQDAKYRELAAIVEASDDAIGGYDLDGNIRSWNRGAERLLGYSAADVIGQSRRLIVSPDRVDQEDDVIERLLRGETVSHFETDRIRKDGSAITVSLSAFPIRNEAGVVTGFAKVARDITDRKHAEARLEAFASELEKRNEELAEARDRALAATYAKSAFLAAMSHEIRTPMNAVLGMAELLGETALSPEQQEYVGRLNRGAVNLLELVNNVLDISKIEADSVKLESVPFDLADAVDDVAELMAVRGFAKNVELIAFVHPDVPTCVVGDPTRIRQVLVNLAGNAVKFTERGEVTIRVEPDPSGPDAICFSVSDTGIGIPADRHTSIFDNFSQVDSSTTRRYGGTGLGLAISKRLVELMGGHVGLRSAVGQGSTFSFVVELGAADASAVREAPVVDLRGRRILVVDDRETNRLIVRSHCARAGARCVEAVDGSRAIVALNDCDRRGETVDVAILDLQMPGMDGVELAQAIRSRRGGSAMPIVMCASEMSAEQLALTHRLGITQVFKPISRRRLFDALARAVATESDGSAETRVADRRQHATSVLSVRVLLVEDLEDNRDLIALFLKDTSHQLTIAENGALGLSAFRDGTFDLVLMDIQMPVMDGYGATAAIRAWELAQGRTPTPILALTASAFQEDVERARAAGCDAHLSKPIKKPLLLDAILRHGAHQAESVYAVGRA